MRRIVFKQFSGYAWMEKEIDWQQAGISKEEAEKVHAVHEFPAGVGRKRQETL